MSAAFDPKRLLPRYFQPTTRQSANRSWDAEVAAAADQVRRPCRGDRNLDAGCGIGNLSFALPEAANVSSVTGIN